jgi:hypothetical protein
VGQTTGQLWHTDAMNGSIAALSLALTAFSCAARDGSGGSVELSWKLRDSRGRLEVSCQAANVDLIRLDWNVDGELGTSTWPCDDNHAITRFTVPSGEASLTISPDCPTGPANPSSYTAPAPLVRSVKEGQVVELGAVVLVLQLDGCNVQPCTCQ